MKKWAVVLVLVVLLASAPVIKLHMASASLTPEIINSARKWANERKIPLQWVLSTILVESSGNPNAGAQTAREDSLGLMQINWNAHGADIEKTGHTKHDLYGVDFNIEYGTLILKRAYDKALRAGVSDVALATRMVYTGRVPTSTFPVTAINWKLALGKTEGIA